jgi:predicted aminopeptidase
MRINRWMVCFVLCFFTGCAKLSYLTEQGIGQARLQWKGVSNEKILNDPKASQVFKQKIILIEEYKKFFFHYFDQKPNLIYSKTTILDRDAVTYLVIASPHNRLKAHEFEFPIMGSFPYLGFFNLDSAKKFALRLREDENLVTWIRPVYAYSTLGYFEDRILSSFFHYDEVELAELIFHELFHTIFFVKDEVDLNENLANLYGKEMLREYFKERPQLKDYLERQKKKDQVDRRIVEMISVLQQEFDKLGGFLTDEKADELTLRFVDEVLKPDLQELCQKLDLEPSECELKQQWNQATFAAFLTYEEEQDFLTSLKQQLQLDLRQFYHWLKQEHKIYDKSKQEISFSDYLKAKVINATPATN